MDSIDFEALCSECGEDLLTKLEFLPMNNGFRIWTDPCKNCKQTAYDEGFGDGRKPDGKEG